jgi:hypothetical protein
VVLIKAAIEHAPAFIPKCMALAAQMEDMWQQSTAGSGKIHSMLFEAEPGALPARKAAISTL